jgi:hypothetical protein
MAREVTARRFRLRPPAAAAVLGVLVVVLAAVYVPLAGLVHQLTILNVGPTVATILIYATVGVVVARHQPGNPVGWILLIFILLITVGVDAGYYAVLAYTPGHHGLPLAAVGVVLEPLWVPAVALFPLVILLFPDGTLTSPRWRWVLRAYAGLCACVMTLIFAETIAAVAGHDVRLDAFGDVQSANHPPGWAAAVLVPIVVIWLSFVAHQVLSWRRATGERRQQLKWLACGAAITLVSFAVSQGFPTSAVGQLFGLGLVALPVSIGVGILKHRLYEVDRIISRTLAYAIVTGLLVGIYAGLVLLATGVLSLSSPVAVAASTLAAAALFSPLRRRVQQAVDRRFNRARYDADQTVAAFAAQLKDAVDLDAVRDDLASVVHQALEPAHISLWISQRDGLSSLDLKRLRFALLLAWQLSPSRMYRGVAV